MATLPPSPAAIFSLTVGLPTSARPPIGWISAFPLFPHRPPSFLCDPSLAFYPLPIPSSAMDRDTSNQHQYGVMETADRNTDFSCITAILSCFVLSVMYVASLYVWNSPYSRYVPINSDNKLTNINVNL